MLCYSWVNQNQIVNSVKLRLYYLGNKARIENHDHQIEEYQAESTKEPKAFVMTRPEQTLHLDAAPEVRFKEQLVGYNVKAKGKGDG